MDKKMANLHRDSKTGRFVDGDGEPMAEHPICVRLPKDLDEAVRALPNRTEFLRDAIARALSEQVKTS
jgi:hypothetical protein